MTRRVPYLGHILRVVLLCLTVHPCRVYGQSASLTATSVPRSMDVYKAYFSDGQSTTAIGNRLPACTGLPDSVTNLSLKLENNVTNQVIQQTAVMGIVGALWWDTAQFPTLLPTLSGRYVCTIFSSSVMVTHTDTYQLNVVVPMDITCTFPTYLNLFYNSMNVLSCNLTGYPQPMVSWSGINQTIPRSHATVSNGTTHITSTASFIGKEIASDAGDFVTINLTAQFPSFTCTSLQNPSTQMSVCDTTPKSVTYSRTLRVVGVCPAFYNTTWIPSTSPVAHYPTRINISCAPGFIGSSPTTVYCQVNGSWTTFPTCTGIVDACLFMPCQINGTCVDEGNRFSCLCDPGYTGQTCETTLPTTTTPAAHPLPEFVVPVAVVGGIVLIGIAIIIALCLLKSKNNRKTPDNEPLPQASHKSKQVLETEDQYDMCTFVRNDGRQPPQQAGSPRVDTSCYMVDMSKKTSRPDLV